MRSHDCLITLAIFLAGIVTGLTLNNPSKPDPLPLPDPIPVLQNYPEPICKISDDIFGNKECNVKLAPRRMTLEFVTRTDFDKMMLLPNPKYTAKGFARIDKTPCEIVLPLDDELSIKYYPFQTNGYASFAANKDSFMVSSTLAHEILHCYIGRWHADNPDFTAWRDRLETLKLYSRYRRSPQEFAEHYLKFREQSWERRWLGEPVSLLHSDHLELR
jgi:hypothetical protein